MIFYQTNQFMKNNLNIISNCCAGGYLYRDYLKIEYPNPFIWNFITASSMFNLIKHYNTINFRNIELKKYNQVIKTQGHLTPRVYNTCTALNIDNTFDVAFPHNIYNPNYNKPLIKGVDVHYRKPHELTYNNWLKRIGRMDQSRQPIYLLITQQLIEFSYNNTLNILTNFPTDKIIVITAYKQLLKENTKSHKIIYLRDIETSPAKVLTQCYQTIYGFIMN